MKLLIILIAAAFAISAKAGTPLPGSYPLNPGIPLTNLAAYQSMIALCGGSYTATATNPNGGSGTSITVTYNYQRNATGTQYDLNVNASAVLLQSYLDPNTGSPVAFSPPRPIIEAGITYGGTIVNDPRWVWSRSGSITYVDFVMSNGQYTAVQKTENF